MNRIYKFEEFVNEELLGIVGDIYKLYKHFNAADDNEIARKVLSKIDKVDPESIEETGQDTKSFTFNLDNKMSPAIVYIKWEFPDGLTTLLGDYEMKINGIEVKCSEFLIRKIFKKIESIYNEEKDALRKQNLGQIV